MTSRALFAAAFAGSVIPVAGCRDGHSSGPCPTPEQVARSIEEHEHEWMCVVEAARARRELPAFRIGGVEILRVRVAGDVDPQVIVVIFEGRNPPVNRIVEVVYVGEDGERAMRERSVSVNQPGRSIYHRLAEGWWLHDY